MTASLTACLFFHICCADGFDSLGRCHCCTLLRSMFRQKETEGLRSPGDILDKGRKCCLGLISEEIFSMRCQNLQPYDLHCSGETFTVQCFHHIGVLLGSDLGHLIDDLQLDALVAQVCCLDEILEEIFSNAKLSETVNKVPFEVQALNKTGGKVTIVETS